MDKTITVDKLISGISGNIYNKDKEIKEAMRSIKIANYNSALINAIANQIVLKAHIKENRLWLDTNKECYLADTAFITNFTNIILDTDIIVSEYDKLVSTGIIEELKKMELFKIFEDAVIKARYDLIKNNENSYHNTIETFVTIVAKSLDVLINMGNETLENIDFSKIFNENNKNNGLNGEVE